eukprot:222994-Pleurochrysis_carterae.AAC.1
MSPSRCRPSDGARLDHASEQDFGSAGAGCVQGVAALDSSAPPRCWHHLGHGAVHPQLRSGFGDERPGRCSAQSRLSCARRRRGHDNPTCALYAINSYLRGGPQGHGWP